MGDTPDKRPPGGHNNDVAGQSKDVFQARDVSGGVHFHGTAATGERIPRQLPADPRGFVNRTQDLARLDMIFAPDDPGSGPIATCVVVGTAGVGKTSLAVHWAHQVMDRFPDGQLYADMHGYDPGPPVGADQALERFLRAMHVPADSIPVDLESRAASYRSLLAGRRLLIVLDNAATVSQIRPLLPGVAGCLVLVTSRSRLSGLIVRDGAQRVTLSMLPEREAVELLRSVMSGYRPPDNVGELQELAALCARLPLALRIAAERAISRPQAPLRDLIEDLRGESALWEALTASDDDESNAVRSVFAWSYRALSVDAGRLFRLLGLHPGSDFSSAAAAALAGLPAGSVRRLLDDLVGAHLLEQIQRDRYQFHDLLRLYATDQARTEESAEMSQTAVRRVLLWYLHTADAAANVLVPEARRIDLAALDISTPVVTFPNHGEASAWFEIERPNLVTATRVAEEMAMHDIAWQLPAVLHRIYAHRNNFDDWFATSLIALGSVRNRGDRQGEAEILQSLGKAHTQAGDRRAGIEFQTAALEIRRDTGDRLGELMSTNAIGLARLRGRELQEALAMFQRAGDLATELNHEYWRAVSSNNIACVHLESGRFEEAEPLLQQALIGYRRLGVQAGEGDTLRCLSHVRRGLGRPGEASEFIQWALDIARAQENHAWEAFWLVEYGTVQSELGHPDDALASFQRAASLQRRLGDRAREASALDATGEAYQRIGRYEEAAGFHRLTVAVFREVDDSWSTALALHNLAAALMALDEAAEAIACWREALTLLADFTDPEAARIELEIRGRGGI